MKKQQTKVFVQAFHSDLGEDISLTEHDVYWSLVAACNMGHNRYKTLEDAVRCVHFKRLGIPTFKRAVRKLRQLGFIDYLSVRTRNGPMVEFRILQANIKYTNPWETAQNSDGIKLIPGDQIDPRGRDQIDPQGSNRSGQEINLILSGDQIDPLPPSSSLGTQSSATPLRINQELIKNPVLDCVHTGIGSRAREAVSLPQTQSANNLRPQNYFPAIEQVSNRFIQNNSKILKQVADVEAMKFVNYYTAKRIDISNSWTSLADNWMLRDLDGNFRKNSVPGMQPVSGSYVARLTPEQRTAMIRSFGFGK